MSFASVSMAALAAASLLAFAPLLIENWGSVFTSNDDVASWDRWAQDWFLNRFPLITDLYPQLLPANWSITYALLGTQEVKMFAKAMMPFFPLAILFLFVSLARNRKHTVYLAGCFIAAVLLFQYVGRDFLITGYADIAFAFFCFLTFYVLYDSEPGDLANARLLALFFASGAAITKQGGLIALGATTAYLVATRKNNGQSKSTLALRWSAGLAVAFVALWYIPKFNDAFHGRTRIGYLVRDIHAGRNYLERIWFGCKLFMQAGGRPGVVLFWMGAALTLSALLFPKTRKLTIGIVLPTFLLWGTLFSYEIRTVVLLFPFLALTWCLTMRCLGNALFSGKRMPPRVELRQFQLSAALLVGTGLMLYYSGEVLPRLRINFTWPMILAGVCTFLVPLVRTWSPNIRLSVPAGSVILALFIELIFWPKYSDAQLLKEQMMKARQIGNPAVNARLYQLRDQGQLKSPILSNYWFLLSLPELKSLNHILGCVGCTLPGLFREIVSDREAGFALLDTASFPSGTAPALSHCWGIETIFIEGPIAFFRIDRSKLRDACTVDPETIRPIIEKLYPGETLAGRVFNVQSNSVAAIGIACRNASPTSVVLWAGTSLVSAYGGPKFMSAEVPRSLYDKPGRYPIEIVDQAIGLRSPPVYFDVK